ncbi:MarR family winged helix-turn-helix transcriptional regulator [Actinomadura rudentiformis]|uniref:Winged helix-turn-helix transcriptional regulator n=1 Tax=Actinomadura rudentiformis TaxID=359158 RepID=A0A6H9YHI2_9ACTN|nr:MarR family winged helix-turn-helix transcriptional regulator [Actinomadura rudentiformis]KAB2345911.1 winged helix-turn-helix transcriptional regulator [Actinomadura rudentiformis]
MTTRSGTRERQHEAKLPLPTLLTQVRDIALRGLHQQLADEGFEGIRYVHGSVFRFIDAEGSRLTTLAERSGLTKQAIGELVGELEDHGYLERVADKADRRAKIIRLTDQGRMAQVAAARILADLEQRWSRHLGKDQVTMLRSALEQVIALEADSTPTGPQ